MRISSILRFSRAFSLAVAAAVLAATAANAADKISIMLGNYETSIYLPAKLAEGLDYFKQEGLDEASQRACRRRTYASG